MKFLIPLLFLLAAPLRAELLATFHTTRGDVVVELQYDKTPQTVANFITLAEGTRTRIDPLTGTVIRKPLYVGEKFYRVVSNSFTKIAQTGSGTGNNNGGPGYTIRDEFHPSLTHVPYVLSMANSGSPHTGGSQIFLTGNINVPEYDNSYTIFGLVTDTNSLAVVDAIIASDNDGTTIISVSFNRTDAAAQAFDEHAQELPVCSGIKGELEVVPGVQVGYKLANPQPGGSVFQVYQSTDLQAWGKFGQLYQGFGESGAADITFGTASLPRVFYNLPLVTYPDALTPASLANRTLVMGLFATQTLTFQFDASGEGGTVTYSADSNGPSPITAVSYSPSGPYGAVWIIETDAYNPFRFTGVLNTETSTQIIGTNTSEYFTQPTGQPVGWYPLSSGTLTLSK